MINQQLCIFGEVLFDHFPDGKRVLGGAPFNVAWHLQAFAQSPYFISRIGSDPEGDTVRKAMSDWGMNTAGLQTDATRPTGQVSVSFNDGEPDYDIVEHCAYDAIAAQDLEDKCGLLYHGSLALRENTSHESLLQLKSCKPGTVFMDVNLRAPWWQRSKVLAQVDEADWVKLNSDELALLTRTNERDTQARDFLTKHRLKGLILTHGSKGAELLSDKGERYKVQPVDTIDVVDTVGAGDAFASVIILGLVNSWPLDITLQRAQAFASEIVGNRGATVSDPAFYKNFTSEWSL